MVINCLSSARVVRILSRCTAGRTVLFSPERNTQLDVSADSRPASNPGPQDFRTFESNPVNHTTEHAARFYVVPPEVRLKVFQYGGLPKIFEKQLKTFGEPSIMVRNPALEVLHYLRTAAYSKPAVRYVLYGKDGCGKSVSLAHILNYGSVSGFLLVHVPWARNWMRYPKEVATSSSNKGCVDLPLDAATWLVHFKSQNVALLNALDLRVSKSYTWTKREETPVGAPLVDLIEFGINRVKYACDVVLALLQEIKLHSTEGRCKTLVVIDGFNAFFNPDIRMKTEDKVKVKPSMVTLAQGFLEITKNDWCNGAVVLSIDRQVGPADKKESELPFYNLGKQGFEHLDPFIPIRVVEYNEKEIESCLQYYIERRWLQHESGRTEAGRKELEFLSGRNPLRLMTLCSPL
ncbi:small ribosomal subunit protein mS29 [Bacillus rossius redtenbacheri]|uniref:small ribosomal subunit protein mS29 n=1 Tax=Bacillus rossius redtenbacheri TaxID=93214 RepID=UPI002FDCA5CB